LQKYGIAYSKNFIQKWYSLLKEMSGLTAQKEAFGSK